MAADGGPSGAGTIYQIKTDGTGYSQLRQFAGGANDGSGPLGSLVQSGALLYGMTPDGGNVELRHGFQNQY